MKLTQNVGVKGFAVVMLALVVVGGFVIATIRMSDGSWTPNGDSAYGASQSFVKQKVDAESLDFPWGPEKVVETNGVWKVVSYVVLVTPQGAKVRVQYVCLLSPMTEKNRWRLIDLRVL